MPNIFHQSIEDILKTATPEQKIIWNDLFLRFGEKISISQFVANGSPAATGLEIFQARYIYFAYQFMFGRNSGVPSNGYSHTILYNESNSINFVLDQNVYFWDTTAAAYKSGQQTTIFKNIWFSRISTASVDYLKFIGYRIGI